jgi:hypothetical protein
MMASARRRSTRWRLARRWTARSSSLPFSDNQEGWENNQSKYCDVSIFPDCHFYYIFHHISNRKINFGDILDQLKKIYLVLRNLYWFDYHICKFQSLGLPTISSENSMQVWSGKRKEECWRIFPQFWMINLSNWIQGIIDHTCNIVHEPAYSIEDSKP